MAFTFDKSDSSGILVKCSSCSYWHAFAWTQPQAWQAARQHEMSAHDSQDHTAEVSARVSAWRARHAE